MTPIRFDTLPPLITSNVKLCTLKHYPHSTVARLKLFVPHSVLYLHLIRIRKLNVLLSLFIVFNSLQLNTLRWHVPRAYLWSLRLITSLYMTSAIGFKLREFCKRFLKCYTSVTDIPIHSNTYHKVRTLSVVFEEICINPVWYKCLTSGRQI